MRNLSATIGVDFERLGTGTNVNKEITVAENTKGRLAVQKDPGVRDNAAKTLLGKEQFMIETVIIIDRDLKHLVVDSRWRGRTRT